MSNEIFGIDIAAIVNDAFAGNLHALTLHKMTETIDDYGAPARTFTDENGEGVRTKWNAQVAAARGYALGTVKILAMQNGMTAPKINDEITILGERFKVMDVEQDPVNATWTVAGVKA